MERQKQVISDEEKSKSLTAITESSGMAEKEYGTDDRRWSWSCSRRTGFQIRSAADGCARYRAGEWHTAAYSVRISSC